jgi:hypothetical protein
VDSSEYGQRAVFPARRVRDDGVQDPAASATGR